MGCRRGIDLPSFVNSSVLEDSSLFLTVSPLVLFPVPGVGQHVTLPEETELYKLVKQRPLKGNA